MDDANKTALATVPDAQGGLEIYNEAQMKTL